MTNRYDPYSGDTRTCPACGWLRRYGHAQSCPEVRRVLSELGIKQVGLDPLPVRSASPSTDAPSEQTDNIEGGQSPRTSESERHVDGDAVRAAASDPEPHRPTVRRQEEPARTADLVSFYEGIEILFDAILSLVPFASDDNLELLDGVLYMEREKRRRLAHPKPELVR